MPLHSTISQGNSQTAARSRANLTAFLHGSQLPVSSSIIVISRHYYLATEIKEHTRTNFHLPQADYKHFSPQRIFPHVRPPLFHLPHPEATTSPSPPQNYPSQVLHPSQPPPHPSSLPPCLPNLDYLQTTPDISPQPNLTAGPQAPQDLAFFIPLSPPLRPRPQTDSFPLTAGLGSPAETEGEAGEGTGRDPRPRGERGEPILAAHLVSPP